VIRNAGVAGFEADFYDMWHAAQPMIEFRPAIEALEPRGCCGLRPARRLSARLRALGRSAAI